MKKFSILIVGMLLVSLLGSCKKDNTGNYKVVFKANVQQPNSGSKTSIQPNGNVLWSTDDAIKVYNGSAQSDFTLINGAGSQSASFGGDIAEADTYYGAYPASAATFSTSGDNKVVTFTLPDTQAVGTTANDFDKNVALMVAASNTQSFAFNNVFGILALDLQRSTVDPIHVSRFALTTKNDSDEIWGTSCSVTVNDDNTFTFNGFSGGTNSITLTCDLTINQTLQTIYIMVPPAPMHGLELKIFDNNDEVYSLETTSTVTIVSNQGASFEHEGQPLIIEPTEPAPAHEYVDLGLPSGLLWATCNIGANAPEEYGDYFAWGETTTKTTYNWSTYVHCMGSDNTFTKYCNKSFRGYNGYTDNLTTLLPEDDAATANWGSGWRMPTKAEFEELYNNTTVTWTQQGGVNGLLFTAANSNSLFLPAAGHREYGELYAPGGSSYYWLSSLYTSGPYYAWNISGSGSNNMDKTNRYLGYPVRPVREPEN